MIIYIEFGFRQTQPSDFNKLLCNIFLKLFSFKPTDFHLNQNASISLLTGVQCCILWYSFNMAYYAIL